MSPTEDKVGPGSYKTKNVYSVESHEFSNIPRLKTPISHNLMYLEAQYPNKNKFESKSKNSFIEKNLSLVTSPKALKDEQKLKLDQHKFNAKKVKEIKIFLGHEIRQKKFEKINRKNQLFMWRMDRKNINTIRIAWTSLVVTAEITLIFFSIGCSKRMEK